MTELSVGDIVRDAEGVDMDTLDEIRSWDFDALRLFLEKIKFVEAVIERLPEGVNRLLEARESLPGNIYHAGRYVHITETTHPIVASDVIRRTACLDDPTVADVLENELNQRYHYLDIRKEEERAINKRYDRAILATDNKQEVREATRRRAIELNEAFHRNKPFVDDTEMERVHGDLLDYHLPQRVNIQATIGYDPRAIWWQRMDALEAFQWNGGRTLHQMWQDRTPWKVDRRVLITLRSIKEHEMHPAVQDLAQGLIEMYS